MRCVCVGSAVQDVFLSHSEAFAPVHSGNKWFEKLALGEKFDVNKIDFSTGGGATNSATTFARGGHDVTFFGTVGRDPAGDAVLTALDREKVDTRFVSYSRKYNTGYSVLLLAPNGERTILTYRGASTHYERQNFDIAKVKHADLVYVTTLAGNFPILRQVFLQAKAMGAKVAFNPGKKELAEPVKMKNLLPMIDILLTNKEEMAQIVGAGDSMNMIKKAIKLVPIAVITDGTNGSLASDGKQIVSAKLYNKFRPSIDRTGAGDAYCSGFTMKILEGESLADAVKFASANSSEVCQAIGAKTNILRRGAKIHDMPMQVFDL